MFTTKNLLILIGKNTIISLIVISITMFSISIFKKEIETITSSIALNNKLESELKKRTELVGTIQEGARIIGSNDILISNAFIPSNNISEFMTALDLIAANNKTIQSYKFETPTQSMVSEPIQLSSIAYSNTLTLSSKDLVNYLKNFEELPYFTKIESLNISSQNENGWSEPSSVTFKASLITKTTK